VTYKITLSNVFSEMNDYPTELEQRLAIAHPNFWFSPQYKMHIWDGKTHFLKLTPTVHFPTGLLFIVEEFLKEKGLDYELIDPRMPIKYSDGMLAPVSPDLLNGITLRDYQITAIEEAIRKRRGVLELPTGSGKTEVAAGIIKLLNRPTLFLVHTQDLLHQTAERFTNRLDIPIGKIGDGEYDIEKRCVVATIQSCHARLKSKEQDKRTEIKQLLERAEVVFQDEVHHASASTWYSIGQKTLSARFRFGLSGTVLRRDELSNMKMLALFGEPIYTKRTMDLVDDGYLSKIQITMIDNPEVVEGSNWQEIYQNGIVKSESRNKMIVDIAEKAFRENKRVLLLIRYIDHGKTLTRLLNEQRSIPTVFLSGQSGRDDRKERKEEFNENGNFILIASTIYDEGIDLPEVNVLIIASGGLSEVKTIQRVGRGLRKKKDGSTLQVFDFNDSSEYLNKHSKERRSVYEAEGFIKETQ
jgi:superfamily II DNA or RNA helicase